jgi:hypothetical protein
MFFSRNVKPRLRDQKLVSLGAGATSSANTAAR